jgi:hypothetical protein
MYKVFLNPENIIEVYNEGEKTPEDQLDTIRQIKDLSAKLRSENKPAIIFDDISKMNLPSEQLRKVGSTIEKILDFDKLAFFTTDLQMKILIKFMIQAGNVVKLRVFTNKDEALAWLKASSI